MATKAKRRRKDRPRTRGAGKANQPISCLLIQWEEVSVDAKGKPICPRCNAPAEMVLGVFGNPCFAHK